MAFSQADVGMGQQELPAAAGLQVEGCAGCISWVMSDPDSSVGRILGGLSPGVCSQPPAGAVQSLIDHNSTGVKLRWLNPHDLEADARRAARSTGRSPLWRMQQRAEQQRGTGSRFSPCLRDAEVAQGHHAAQAGTRAGTR